MLIAGRVQRIPQVSFNVEPFGAVASNTERVDVRSSAFANGVKRVMRPKLISQATVEAVSLTDVNSSVASVAEVSAKNVDPAQGVIGN